MTDCDRDDRRSSRLFFSILALLTAVALRAGRGYRPFPAPDDLAYVPLVWAGSPGLYPRDTFVQVYQVLLHAPMWKVLVVTLESTLDLPWGFWIVTTLLTVASVLAVAWLLRSTGVQGFFLPVAAVLVYGASVGLGRGKYDGARQQRSDPVGGAVSLALVLRRAHTGPARSGRRAARRGLPVAPAGCGPRRLGRDGCRLRPPAKRNPAISVTGASAALVGLPAIVPIARSLVTDRAMSCGATPIIASATCFDCRVNTRSTTPAGATCC